MKRWLPFALMAVVSMTTFAAASVAMAASVLPSYDVQLWVGADESNPDAVVLIAGVRVPDDIPLPMTVRVPLPDGVRLTWAGEILGGDPSADIQRETTIVAGGGGRAVEFTLFESRDGQVEGFWMPLERSGAAKRAKARWVQVVPTDRVDFSVRLPPGAGDVSIIPMPPGAPQQNERGERLFTLPSKPLGLGEAYELEFSFVPGALAADPGSSGVSTQVLVGSLGGLALILAIAVAALLRRERERAGHVDVEDG